VRSTPSNCSITFLSAYPWRLNRHWTCFLPWSLYRVSASGCWTHHNTVIDQNINTPHQGYSYRNRVFCRTAWVGQRSVNVPLNLLHFFMWTLYETGMRNFFVSGGHTLVLYNNPALRWDPPLNCDSSGRFSGISAWRNEVWTLQT